VVAVAALVAGLRYQSRPQPAQRAEISLSTPQLTIELPAPGAASAAPPAFRDLIEVTGIRTFYDAQDKPQVRVVVVNHSEEHLDNLTFTVALRPAGSAPGSQPLARFSVRVSSLLKAGSSREITAPLETLATLAAFPPWRDLRADVEHP
jgi:hypothetical protein